MRLMSKKGNLRRIMKKERIQFDLGREEEIGRLQEKLAILDIRIQLLNLVRQQTQKKLEGLLCQPVEDTGAFVRA